MGNVSLKNVKDLCTSECTIHLILDHTLSVPLAVLPHSLVWGALVPHLQCGAMALPFLLGHMCVLKRQGLWRDSMGLGLQFCHQPAGNAKQLPSPVWVNHSSIKKMGLEQVKLENGATKTPPQNSLRTPISIRRKPDRLTRAHRAFCVVWFLFTWKTS